MWLALGAKGTESRAATIPPRRNSSKMAEMVGVSTGHGVGRPRVKSYLYI